MDNFGQPPHIPNNQYQPPSSQPPIIGPSPMPGMKPKGVGCGLGGCLIGCLVMIVLTLGLAGGTAYYMYNWFNKYAFQDEPLDIATVELTDEQKDAVSKKFLPVKEAFDKDTGETIELELSQDEITYLFMHGNEMNSSPGHDPAAAGIEFPAENQIVFKASIPVTKENEVQYVNIEGSAEIEVVDGKVTAKILKAVIGGYVVPGAFIEGINTNLSEQLQNEPELQDTWERVKGLKIQSGTIHLNLRALKWPTKTTTPSSDSGGGEPL